MSLFNLLGVDTGNKNLLIKIKRGDLIVANAFYVEIKKRSGASEDKEYESFRAILYTLLKVNKRQIEELFDNEDDALGRRLFELMFEANEVLSSYIDHRMEFRQAGFFVNKVNHFEFFEHPEYKKQAFNDKLEVSIPFEGTIKSINPDFDFAD